MSHTMDSRSARRVTIASEKTEHTHGFLPRLGHPQDEDGLEQREREKRKPSLRVSQQRIV